MNWFKRKRPPPFTLVTDGEKWAVKDQCGLLLRPSKYVSPYFSYDKTDENCWMAKDVAEQYLRRLMA